MFSFALIYLSFPALVLSAAHPGVESIGRRTAQTTATCTGSFNWMENERGLSPCLVSAYVQGACTTNDFTTPAIQAGNNYNAPSGSTANACTCSWASYNLLQACTICQEVGGITLAWAAYQEGCAKYISATTYFPAGVTLASNTTLPAWAGTDPTKWTNEQFDASQAEADSGSGHPDLVPDGDANGSSSSTGHKKSSTGAIVGGVIGGLAALVLIGLGIAFCIRRKRRQDIEKIEPHHPRFVASPGGIDDSITHARSMSDGSTKYNYPSIVGDMGNGSGMLLANRPPMSTLPSSSSMIMSVAEHARSLSSPSAHSLNLPYTAQPHPGSPPPSIMRSVSPAMSVQPSTNVPFSAMQSNEWDARTTDVVSPMGVVTPTGMLTPTGMISPTGMYSSSGDEPTQALSDDTISPVSPPRARLNPPAYSRHADSPPETVAGASVPFAAPEIPEGGIVPYDVRSTGHARGGQTEKGSSDTSFSNTSYSNTSYSTFHASAGDRNTSVGSVDQMNGLLGNLGLGSDAGESTYDGASEGGETYPSSVLGGMSSRLGPSTPRKSAMGRDMKLATPMEDHREDDPDV